MNYLKSFVLLFILTCVTCVLPKSGLTFDAKGLKNVVSSYENEKQKVGIHVFSLDQNKELFSHHAQNLMNPASNVKILSSAAAFALLGEDYKFETSFKSLGPIENGVLQNLYIVGGGDPQITEEKVAVIAEALINQGVRQINGDIIIDQSLFDKRGFGESMGNSGTYRAPLNALVVNFNRFGVIVSPGKNKPEVAIDFPSDYFVVKNELRNGKGSVSVTKKFNLNKETVLVRGSFRGKKEQVIYRDVSYPSLFAGYFFKSFFEKKGIKVSGIPREGAAPNQAVTIYTHESDPLHEIIKVMNKRSINFTAEMVTKFLGAKFRGAPASTGKGVEVVGDYLKSLGIADFVLENGSGLSRTSKITPAALTRVFKSIKDQSYNQKYLDTLAIAGEDGTVRKRFRDSMLKGRAYLKTGTLNGVSSLAGYVETMTGHQITFSILVNGPGLNAWKAHEFQENVLEAIVR